MGEIYWYESKLSQCHAVYFFCNVGNLSSYVDRQWAWYCKTVATWYGASVLKSWLGPTRSRPSITCRPASLRSSTTAARTKNTRYTHGWAQISFRVFPQGFLYSYLWLSLVILALLWRSLLDRHSILCLWLRLRLNSSPLYRKCESRASPPSWPSAALCGWADGKHALRLVIWPAPTIIAYLLLLIKLFDFRMASNLTGCLSPMLRSLHGERPGYRLSRDCGFHSIWLFASVVGSTNGLTSLLIDVCAQFEHLPCLLFKDYSTDSKASEYIQV